MVFPPAGQVLAFTVESVFSLQAIVTATVSKVLKAVFSHVARDGGTIVTQIGLI